MSILSHTNDIQPESSYPGFLALLDSDPKQAADRFYRYVIVLFGKAPPKVLRSLPEDVKPDMIHDIVVHCIRNNFRVLKKYENKGRPFAIWFYFISRNYVLDHLPKYIETIEPDDVSTGPSNNPGEGVENRQILEKVNLCLAKIDDYCRLLLRMAGDELVPREMVKVLGWQQDKAKKVSNDLGYCRKKLEDMLTEFGLDIDHLK